VLIPVVVCWYRIEKHLVRVDVSEEMMSLEGPTNVKNIGWKNVESACLKSWEKPWPRNVLVIKKKNAGNPANSPCISFETSMLSPGDERELLEAVSKALPKQLEIKTSRGVVFWDNGNAFLEQILRKGERDTARR
jgi:hypothetical protein